MMAQWPLQRAAVAVASELDALSLVCCTGTGMEAALSQASTVTCLRLATAIAALQASLSLFSN